MSEQNIEAVSCIAAHLHGDVYQCENHRPKIKDIVAFVYNYIEEADCSCPDGEGTTCWYHMSDEERIDLLTKWVLDKINQGGI